MNTSVGKRRPVIVNLINNFIFLASITFMQSTMAVIYRYQVYFNPTQGDTLYLFSDLHLDTDDLKMTMTQVEQLSRFIRMLPDPKEVIVEDTASLASHLHKQSLPPENIIAQSGPPGDALRLVASSPLLYITLGYGMQNIPVYNIEFRLPGFRTKGWSFAKAVKTITEYNDGPVLAPHYKSAINVYKKHGKTFEALVRLLDVNILHRIYHNIKNSFNTQVVIAGGVHIDNIIDAIEDLGYKKITDHGLIGTEAMKIAYGGQHDARVALESDSSLSKLKARKKIDTIYRDMMEKLTLNLDDLPKSLELIKQYEQKLRAPQSKL